MEPSYANHSILNSLAASIHQVSPRQNGSTLVRMTCTLLQYEKCDASTCIHDRNFLTRVFRLARLLILSKTIIIIYSRPTCSSLTSVVIQSVIDDAEMIVEPLGIREAVKNHY